MTKKFNKLYTLNISSLLNVLWLHKAKKEKTILVKELFTQV